MVSIYLKLSRKGNGAQEALNNTKANKICETLLSNCVRRQAENREHADLDMNLKEEKTTNSTKEVVLKLQQCAFSFKSVFTWWSWGGGGRLKETWQDAATDLEVWNSGMTGVKEVVVTPRHLWVIPETKAQSDQVIIWSGDHQEM